MYVLAAVLLYITVMTSASISDIRTRHVADWHWMVLGAVATIGHVVCTGVCMESVIGASTYIMLTAYMFSDRACLLVTSIILSASMAVYGYMLPIVTTSTYLAILGMYNLGLVRGGADAKALMCICMMFPPSTMSIRDLIINPTIEIMLSSLMLSLTGCIWVLYRNLSDDHIHRRMFTEYMVDDGCVPRFTWVTRELDDGCRMVTPMIPFIVPLTITSTSYLALHML